MATKYTHRVTIAAPESMIAQANQLALIVGESAADDQTFGTASYQDALLNKFAIASTVTTVGFLSIPSLGLPENPSYAEDADRTAAQEALDSLNPWSPPEDPEAPPVTLAGIMMSIDIDPQTALSAWGLTAVPEAEA